MMFILRAVFWLAVMSAIMPSRDGAAGSQAFNQAAGEIAATARSCADFPLSCLEETVTYAGSVRIPRQFVERAQLTLSPGEAKQREVPLPMPRPAAI